MNLSHPIALALSAALLAACASSNNGSGDEELTGTASIAITNAPSDGTCIQLTAVGYRTVTEAFSVSAGASTVLAFGGLPLGAVTFSANAFSGTCQGLTAMSVPNWISNQVQANVAVAPPVTVALEMERNGNASVSVDFPNEPDGSSSQPPMCTAPLVLCSGACANLTSDPNNCGKCGGVCATPNAKAACTMGVCSVASCNAGFANCNGNATDGCETNTLTNAANCGGCGVVCPMAHPTCANGMCM